MYIHERNKENNLFIPNTFYVLVNWHVGKQALIYSKQGFHRNHKFTSVHKFFNYGFEMIKRRVHIILGDLHKPMKTAYRIKPDNQSHLQKPLYKYFIEAIKLFDENHPSHRCHKRAWPTQKPNVLLPIAWHIVVPKDSEYCVPSQCKNRKP